METKQGGFWASQETEELERATWTSFDPKWPPAALETHNYSLHCGAMLAQVALTPPPPPQAGCGGVVEPYRPGSLRRIPYSVTAAFLIIHDWKTQPGQTGFWKL